MRMIILGIVFMKFTNKTLAGALIFLGTMWLLMAIVVSEVLYPGYHDTQMISDLGIGSTSLIFNASIIFCGILIIAAAYLLQKAGTDIWFSALMAMIGIGEVCVGLFPEDTGTPHIISASIVFLCGCIIAIVSFRVFPSPWAWFSGAIGIIVLAAIILFIVKYNLGLSSGGMERIIAYPLLFWALGSSAFLMAPENSVQVDST